MSLEIKWEEWKGVDSILSSQHSISIVAVRVWGGVINFSGFFKLLVVIQHSVETTE